MLFDPKWNNHVAPKKGENEAWRQVLLGAASMLENFGWLQHKPHHLGIRMCAGYAIGKSSQQIDPTNDLYEMAVDRLCKYLPDFDGHTGMSKVVAWNDQHGQTAANVIATLREVANKAA
jgi:hypothetical protein